MKSIQRVVAFVLVVLSLISSSTTPVIAASENFDISLTSTYTVDAVGVTKVTHNFNITNTEPTIFLTQYALRTSYPDLKNVIVRYQNEVLIPNVVQDETSTSIAINFPDEVVGEGKTRSFIIEYTNTNLATLAGEVLELHVPELSEAAEYTKHTAIIKVPEKYGYPPRITPEPTTVATTDGQFVLQFDNLNGADISAIFGNTQTYGLTLRYQLENTTSGTALAQIALPPDTAFQTIHIYDIDPQPESLKTDADGNWIATYQIAPTSATNVYVTAAARVQLEPITTRPLPTPTQKMLAEDQYWEVQAPLIQDFARKFKTPLDIYTHVVSSLSYNSADLSAGVSRQGAVQAFAQPEQAVCQEFSDTFIAIARAASIPARRNVGYGYAENNQLRPSSYQGDLLHAWPEYWNQEKQLWIPVDPTWGNTTGGIDYFSQFDLNHIVFAINGESSTTPYPAGSYKNVSNETTQDVDVSFAQEFPEVEPSLSIRAVPKKVFGIPLPGIMNVTIRNNTGRAWYNVAVQVRTDDPSSTIQFVQNAQIPILLPYEQRIKTVTAYQPGITLPKEIQVTPAYTVQGTTYDHQKITITTGPQIVEYITDQTVILALAGGSVFLTLVAGSLLVLRQRR